MYQRIIASVAVFGTLAAAAYAGGGKCQHCGAGRGDLVCHLVKSTKTVTKTCYDCTSEDVCVPGPSTKCKKHVEPADGKCNFLCNITWTEWIPGCAKMRTRNKLTKYIVKKEVPSYKWVVSKCCDGCKTKIQSANVEPGIDVPTPPIVDAELRYGNPHNVPMRFEPSSRETITSARRNSQLRRLP